MALYRGDEVRFTINLTAPGFSMADDDFEIEVSSSRGGSIKGYKTPPAGEDPLDVIIFSETVETTVPAEEPEGEPTVESTTTWYVIADTSKLNAGELKVIGTAYVPDAHANDGVRRQTAVNKDLGILQEP